VRVRWARAAAAVLSALGMASCGSSKGAGTRGGHAGTVSVLYAGSLVNLMEHDLGPAFAKATGYSYQGFGAGSTELVAQIKSHVRQGDVFISASPKADAKLEGQSNGKWVTWYITFARSPLVIGYSAHSSFASRFRTTPWYKVITHPGIKVGRTDPVLDPKGKLTVKAVEQAAAKLHLPSLVHSLGGFPVFPEETLVGRLEAGQLDAGFFYSVEARDQHIPTVPLKPISSSATYTVTVLARASNAGGAAALVRFLLGPVGRATLKRHGLQVLTPALTGPRSAVPASLRTLPPG
jgi:molybdate/tungstate transport system substrate-binding protein